MARLETGIAGLDQLLKGGLPESSAIGIIGDVGSGKELICNQIVWNLLQRDVYVLYYPVDKSAEDIKDDMIHYGWDIEPYVKEDKLHFVDAFSRGMEIIQEKMYAFDKDEGDMVTPDKISFNFKEMISEGRNYALKMTLRRRKLFVVYYSLSPLFTVSDQKEVLRFLHYAKYATRISKAVGFAVLHSGLHGDSVENSFRQLADGIIETRKKNLDGHVARFLRIGKMARTEINENYYPLELTSNEILVHPYAVTSI